MDWRVCYKRGLPARLVYINHYNNFIGVKFSNNTKKNRTWSHQLRRTKKWLGFHIRPKHSEVQGIHVEELEIQHILTGHMVSIDTRLSLYFLTLKNSMTIEAWKMFFFYFSMQTKLGASRFFFVDPHIVLEQTYITGSIYHQCSLQNIRTYSRNCARNRYGPNIKKRVTKFRIFLLWVKSCRTSKKTNKEY